MHLLLFVGMDQKESIRDIIPWDGTLSSSDFFRAACAFSGKWKRFNASVPPWLWVPSPKHHLLSSHKVDLLSLDFYIQCIIVLCLAAFMVFLYLCLCQEEGYLSLENMCLVKSSEVCQQFNMVQTS